MPENSKLNDSIQYLKSIGPKRATAFEKAGIRTIFDLLHYFPSRHLDRTNVLTTAQALNYLIKGYEGEVTIIGKVVSKEIIRYGNKQILKVQLKDSKGFFECIWFQGIKYFTNKFNAGELYAISAKPVLTKYGNFQLTHPDFDRISDEESTAFLNTGEIIPFYKVSKELKSVNLGDITLRSLLKFCVNNFSNDIDEILPENVINENNLLSYSQCIKNLHFPQNQDMLKRAKQRIIFNEFFYFEIIVALKKTYLKEIKKTPSLKIKSDLIKKFLTLLPFELTKAQLATLHDIRKELESEKPLMRLIQGDVGSGKTVVALISMLIAVDNNYQAILMAPTEILAQQHYKTITKLLEGLNINIHLITGGSLTKQKRKTIEKIATETPSIIIGTHALIEANIVFKNPGLVIIDEQHRFGVAQRSILIDKGFALNTLVMTATPIPRTLSLTLYGDLDISIIYELPANRIPIKTYVRGDSKLPSIYKFIKNKIAEGYQSYIIYPLVEESEKSDLKSAEEYFNELSNSYLKEYRIALLHGRMTSEEKDEIMNKFKAKEFDVLISTTVIEVGIDVPDANIIVINDAHQFGISQLHQLRGRVGRSNKQAYCILVTKDYFAEKVSDLNFEFEFLSKDVIEKNKTLIKLNSMVKYNSGFDLSEIDLKLRGPGNILGTEQSGMPEFKYANLVNDQEILIAAKKTAFNLIANDPLLNKSDNIKLRKFIIKNFSQHLKYSQIA